MARHWGLAVCEVRDMAEIVAQGIKIRRLKLSVFNVQFSFAFFNVVAVKLSGGSGVVPREFLKLDFLSVWVKSVSVAKRSV